jgi:hypothetical protein
MGTRAHRIAFRCWLGMSFILHICSPYSPSEAATGLIDLKVAKDITPYEKGGTYGPARFLLHV